MNDALKYPLREKRKQRTRAALESAAAELFEKKGYEETRLEEVAEMVGVHVQTLYRHFPTKEELAIAPDRAAFDRFEAAIQDPSRNPDTLSFWRDWVEESAMQTLERFPERYLKRRKQRDQIPSLAAASLRLWHQYEDLLTTSIANELSLDPDEDQLPRLFGCMLWGGHQHALRRWQESDGATDLARETLSVIDQIKDIYSAVAPARRKTKTKARKK